jgi:glycosyltransferase involved in cell wall biosynthesis
MVYGRWSKQIAIEEGFDPSKVHVIGNCLDLAAQQSALSAMPETRPEEVRIALFGESTTAVVACTSRLTRVRRLDMLLDALVILRDKGHKTNVIIIGDGPERVNLEKQAAKLDISVAFIGACYDESRIGELLRASNVTVAPGKVGLTAMHSMAFGIPVVTHGNHEEQMPEFEAIVPGKTGALFKEGNLNSLADAIKPWIQEQWPRSQTSLDCQTIVDRFWSPKFQCAAILRAVEGHPADDLFYVRLKQEQTDAGLTS